MINFLSHFIKLILTISIVILAALVFITRPDVSTTVTVTVKYLIAIFVIGFFIFPHIKDYIGISITREINDKNSKSSEE